MGLHELVGWGLSVQMPVTDLGQAPLRLESGLFSSFLLEISTVFPDQPRESTPVGKGRLRAQP